MSTYIESKKIQAFVTAVEKKKQYKRDPGLILRHLFEEVGELSRELWLHEIDAPMHLSTGDMDPDIPTTRKGRLALELVDIISLANYLADVLEIDLNETFPKRMRLVARQYGVEIPEVCL